MLACQKVLTATRMKHAGVPSSQTSALWSFLLRSRVRSQPKAPIGKAKRCETESVRTCERNEEAQGENATSFEPSNIVERNYNTGSVNVGHVLGPHLVTLLSDTSHIPLMSALAQDWTGLARR